MSQIVTAKPPFKSENYTDMLKANLFSKAFLNATYLHSILRQFSHSDPS